MKRMVAAALLMTMSGCAATPPADAEEVPVRGAGSCDASTAQGLVGQERSGDVGAQAMRLTGARTVRWIPEGGIVTMDFRKDRVNLHLDRNQKVVKVACG